MSNESSRWQVAGDWNYGCYTTQDNEFISCNTQYSLSLFSLLQAYNRWSTVWLPLAQGHISKEDNWQIRKSKLVNKYLKQVIHFIHSTMLLLLVFLALQPTVVVFPTAQ
jgi:hypothetical protein